MIDLNLGARSRRFAYAAGVSEKTLCSEKKFGLSLPTRPRVVTGSPKSVSNKKVPSVWLVDGHLVAHRCYHADREAFVRNFCGVLDQLCLRAKREHPESKIVTVFDRPGVRSWRARKASAYKRNRLPTENGFKQGLQDLQEGFFPSRGLPFVVAPEGLEGDDVLAELGMKYNNHESYGPSTIVSADKDLLQLLRDGVRVFDPFAVDPDMGNRFGSERGLFLTSHFVREKFGIPHTRVGEYLAIMGDSCDGVAGVTGFGAKAASAIVSGKNVNEHQPFKDLLHELLFLPTNEPENKSKLGNKSKSKKVGSKKGLSSDKSAVKLTFSELVLKERRKTLRGMGIPSGAVRGILEDPKAVLAQALESWELVRLPPPRNAGTKSGLEDLACWELEEECAAALEGRDGALFEAFKRRHGLEIISERGSSGLNRTRSTKQNVLATGGIFLELAGFEADAERVAERKSEEKLLPLPCPKETSSTTCSSKDDGVEIQTLPRRDDSFMRKSSRHLDGRRSGYGLEENGAKVDHVGGDDLEVEIMVEKEMEEWFTDGLKPLQRDENDTESNGVLGWMEEP